MIDFKDLADYCQAEALAGKLSPTDDSVWRTFCRQYSQIFYTPLHIVEELDPAKVMLAVYEDQLADVDVDNNLEQLFDIIYTLEDPEYAAEKREELKAFIKDAEREEEERLESGRPIHKMLADEDEVSLKKNTSKTTPSDNKKMPHSGGINLSYLENQDNEG